MTTGSNETHNWCGVTIDNVDEGDGGLWQAVIIGYHENDQGQKTDYELHQYSQMINLQGKQRIIIFYTNEIVFLIMFHVYLLDCF